MSAFNNNEFEKHEAEAKEKWGRTSAYNEYSESTKNYSEQNWNDLAEGMDSIMAEFALCMKNENAADSAQAQNLVKTLQNYITENCYHCTNEILAGLGEMYVADERFRSNVDKHADGTALFISQAIGIYCNR